MTIKSNWPVGEGTGTPFTSYIWPGRCGDSPVHTIQWSLHCLILWEAARLNQPQKASGNLMTGLDTKKAWFRQPNSTLDPQALNIQSTETLNTSKKSLGLSSDVYVRGILATYIKPCALYSKINSWQVLAYWSSSESSIWSSLKLIWMWKGRM